MQSQDLNHKPDQDYIIKTQHIGEIVGLHPKTVRRMEDRGEFPRGVVLSVRQRGYMASDVYNWLESRRA